MKNMLALLFLSRGTPMVLYGDEFGRSAHGNNNIVFKNEHNLLDWTLKVKHADIFTFMQGMIALRKRHRVEERQITWHGVRPHEADLGSAASRHRMSDLPSNDLNLNEPAPSLTKIPGGGGVCTFQGADLAAWGFSSKSRTKKYWPRERTTKHTKNIKGRPRIPHDEFVFGFRVLAEVHKQAESIARGLEIIVDLSAVEIVECLASISHKTAHPQPSVRRDCNELPHARMINRWAE